MINRYDHSAEVYFDGSTHLGNPGTKFGIGGVIYDCTLQKTVKTISKCIDKPGTNNLSEFTACYVSLMVAVKKGYTKITIYGDSKLVIKAVNGEWKLKDFRLFNICNKIHTVLKTYNLTTEFIHIRREYNSEADYFSNLCYGEGFLTKIKKHTANDKYKMKNRKNE